MRLASVLFVALLLVGCTTVRSNISVFHDLPQNGQPLKYAALPLKGQEGSLEHQSYVNLVKAELNRHGYVETSPSDADIIVFLNYGIDSGREVVSSYPIYGRTGTSSSYTTGTITNYGSFATYNGTTYNTPTYGVVGTGARSDTVFTRFLALDFLDRADLAAGKVTKKYEAKVVSEGSSGQLAAVVPAMIEALFKDFPGRSGSTRRADVPLRR